MRALLIGTVFSTALVASASMAQDGSDPAAGSENARAEAQRLFAEGRSALDEERFAEAEALFRRSLALEAHVPTVFNLAFSLRELDRPTEASRYLERLANGEMGALTPEQSAELQSFRSETEARLGRIVVSVDGADEAEVLIDGEASWSVSRHSELVRTVDPGAHVVTARSAGLPDQRGEVDVAMGASTRLQLRFEALPAPVDALAEAEPPADPMSLESTTGTVADDDGGGVPAWVWIIGGILLAGAAVSVAVALTTSGGGDDVLGTVEVLRWSTSATGP